MKVEHRAAVVLVAYCPVNSNQEVLEEFTKSVGGASVSTVRGYWVGPDNTILNENSNRWEWVLTETPSEDISEVGKTYLQDNPNELEFMATAHIGDTFRVIKVSRDRSEILGI